VGAVVGILAMGVEGLGERLAVTAVRDGIHAMVKHEASSAAGGVGRSEPKIIEHPSQKAARKAAQREAGMGKHGRRKKLPNKPLRPGSRSPQGDPGVRTEVQSADTGKIVHHDPYGHKVDNIGPHYGVDGPNGTTHHTYPTTHNPQWNR